MAVGIAGWAASIALPGVWGRWLSAPQADLFALGSVLLALLATRSRRRAPGAAPMRTLAVAALALAAGGLAAPCIVRGLMPLGVQLGLPLSAPQPPLAPPFPLALSALLLGPWVEELLYRERLLTALRGCGAIVAIGGTTLLFGLAHADPWARLAALACGAFLGVAMWHTGSLALCTGFHAGLNASVLLLGVPVRSRGAAPALGALAAAGLLAMAVHLARGHRARLAAAGTALVLGGALAGPAVAEVQVFDGRLRFESLPSSLPAVEIEGVGVATVNGSGAGVALRTLALAGGIAGTAIVPVTDPLVSNGGVVEVAAAVTLGAGSLRSFQPPLSFPQPQLGQATLPIAGELRLCIFLPDCVNPFALPLQGTSGGSTVGAGVGGLVTAYPLSTVMLSLFGAPWTLRTASLPVTTSGGASFFAVTTGFAHGPASFTGSTAVTGGALGLVTPLRIDAIGGPGPSSGFAHLEVRFLPEPRSLLLLGPGLACLALAVRLRRA